MIKKSITFLVIILVVASCSNKPVQIGDNVEKTPTTTSSELQAEKNQEIPSHTKAHFKQGTYFLRKGDYENAIRKLQLAIKQKPDFIQAHYNLGLAYFDTDRMGLAIDEWKKTLELDPDYARTYLSLGYAYEKLSNNDKAVENYEKFLQFSPEDPKAKKIGKKIDSLRNNISGQGIIGRIVITNKVSAKTFEPVESKNIFNDNEPAIFTTADIGDAPKETKIKAVWYYLGLKGEEILVNSKEKVVTGPQKMVFQINRPAKNLWPLGRYELRIYVDGKENLSVPYTILKGDKK